MMWIAKYEVLAGSRRAKVKRYFHTQMERDVARVALLPSVASVSEDFLGSELRVICVSATAAKTAVEKACKAPVSLKGEVVIFSL
ncbi:unnamed protein product [Gongylonema pulchrum]|uniref:DUF4242 domain-containing protein n=1 Tax=Gongylonema pulchrum TaxID=637853 RepID=A0A183ETJ6_9BILA|nr:unnamed protein product [Gongylonema pulchrum]